ncbi:IstB-like ATP-binding domain-containing protein [Alicyclobacillus curvatus]|nr:IstB-like ATP-binding domain-containing protein [Alicyclobacillus curvatus]
MLSNQTINTLRQLRLNGMADAYSRQLKDAHAAELAFDDRLGLLVDHEWTLRQNRQLSRLLQAAHLRVQAAPEEIDYQVPRGLDRSLIQQLLTGQWLTERHNLLISGPTGPVSWYSSSLFGHSKGLIPSELQLNFTVFV